MPINVFIADDQNLVRKGLRWVLEKEFDMLVVGEAGDGFACLNEVNKLNPNIVIMDVDMKKLDGIKTLRIMKEQAFSAKVLLLADDDNPDKLLEAVEAECDGYILKDCDSYEFKNALFTIYEGGTYIQASLKNNLDNSIVVKNSAMDKLNNLTRRETEILKLVAIGMFNKDIAMKLKISERTVKNHISNIFKKIQVIDRTQAAVFAIKNNLIKV